MQTSVLTISGTILLFCFPSGGFRKIICILLFVIGMFCVIAGIEGFQEVLDEPLIFLKKTSVLMIAGFLYLYAFVFIGLNFGNQLLLDLDEKLKNEEEYKFMLDKLEHSIIIIKKDQIEFVNHTFLS